jgi:ubiquitin carboxyl-terminal hydrolase 34
MNSMMQQFFNVPSFRYCLLSANDEVQTDLQEHQGYTFDDNFLHQIMNMFGHLILSDRQFYNPTPLCYSFKSYDGGRTNVREQKDAQEFLNVAFDRLENLLKGTSQKYLLNNTFGGKTCEIQRCKNCGTTRKNSDVFFNLSLEVKNQSSIHDGLKKLTTPEIISDWKCDECNTTTDLEKTTTIADCPNTLIVHLQRITFDFEVMRNVKYNDRIEFPNVLDLKPFSTNEIMKNSDLAEKK